MLFRGSFEDYLYIIIGLIWVAFSIYKGAQKKKAKSQSHEDMDEAEEPTVKKSIFENFLNEIIKDEEPIQYEPVEIKEEVAEPVQSRPNEEEKIFSYDDYYEESNFLSKSNVYKDRQPLESTLNQELQTHLKASKQKPRFDLRKAVIYSEILNRRYF